MPGTFTFRPIEANLTHDTDWLGKMDPYCAYMINNQRIKGQVCKKGGQHPIWNDSVQVQDENNQPACVVEIMDKDRIIDDSIGTFVIDLNEVKNLGSVSKWYPVFHKNKPAGQILFETNFQGLQQQQQQLAQPVTVIQPIITETVLVEEVPRTQMVQETVVEREILPEERFQSSNIQQSGFQSRGGVIPVGGESLDGPLYGKVVHHQKLSNLPDQPLGGVQQYGLNQQSVPLGGPLSGSLGGGKLGTSELLGNQMFQNAQVVNTRTEYIETQQLPNQQFLGNQNLSNQQFMGNQNLPNQQSMGNQNLGNQNLGNQNLSNQDYNLQQNFNSTSMSNAQLGGGAPLYKETANHPQTNTNKNHSLQSHQNPQGNMQGFTEDNQMNQGGLNQGNMGNFNNNQGNLLPGQQGNIVPGDLIGGHNQANQNLGNQGF